MNIEDIRHQGLGIIGMERVLDLGFRVELSLLLKVRFRV